jgi:hypothetical protein
MGKWSVEDQDTALEAIERTGVNLTVWEESFVESLRTQRNAGRALSEKQVEILERIYADRTP